MGNRPWRIFLRPLLFSLPPETSHQIVIRLLQLLGASSFLRSLLEMSFSFRHPVLRFQLFGKNFLSPVGLAAGFDKNCKLFHVLSAFGFGFIESGTVTPLPQSGNPKPRILRLPEEKGLLNRLGFNNCGAEIARKHLMQTKKTVPLGVSIGKNSFTPNSEAWKDYLFVLEKCYPFADYFAVNVSSPNTAGLRDLQNSISELLSALQEKNRELANRNAQPSKPIFLKVSPDLKLDQLERVAEECVKNQIQGVIATNTLAWTAESPAWTAESTTSYNFRGLPSNWGLSGRPLRKKSTEVIRQLYKNFGKKLTLIGVGGIFSAEDAYEKIKAGASLVQIYTGWIYEGPGLIQKMNEGLVGLVERDGFKNIQEAVGTEC